MVLRWQLWSVLFPVSDLAHNSCGGLAVQAPGQPSDAAVQPQTRVQMPGISGGASEVKDFTFRLCPSYAGTYLWVL